MTVIQLLSLFFLLVTVNGDHEPECEGISVVVNYDMGDSEYSHYIMSMTADDSYDSCGPWDKFDLKDLLLGSGKMWRSTCKKTVPHVLIIEPNVECRGEEWIVQYLTFKVKGAKIVEIWMDEEKIYSEMVGLYFQFHEEIMKPGRTVKIVAYPKWRFTCVVFFDLQVNFCCIPKTTTVTTTTPSTTTAEPERECKPLCVPIPFEELVADDGAECTFITEEQCRWVCNGTCFVEDLPGATEVGTIYIDTEPREVDEIAHPCECCSSSSGVWDEFPVECTIFLPDGSEVLEDRTIFIYRITFCECKPCDHTTTTTTPTPYEYPPYGENGVPPYVISPPYGVPPYGGPIPPKPFGYWPPWYYYPYGKKGHYEGQYGDPYGPGPHETYGPVYGQQPPYGQPPYGKPPYGEPPYGKPFPPFEY